MSPFTETKDKDKDKDYKKSKKEEKFLFGSMDAESIKPHKSALRLFRTVIEYIYICFNMLIKFFLL